MECAVETEDEPQRHRGIRNKEPCSKLGDIHRRSFIKMYLCVLCVSAVHKSKECSIKVEGTPQGAERSWRD